ncbi:MAG: hypothetical protein K6G49_03370 [Candidatus Saccharibacteria bacterium]|nr:hypothetical protein [Candidatus Saccharibacteria bacterium]
MSFSAEKINNNPENQQSLSHPLEDMPSFDEHLRQIESAAESPEPFPKSDEIVDRIFDRTGRGHREGYFGDPNRLAHRFDQALQRSPREVIQGFRQQIQDYEVNVDDEHAQAAEQLFRDTEQNVKRLIREHLVGGDTVKAFLTPDFLDQRYGISEYNTIQKDESRRKANPEEVWADSLQISNRYQFRTKELADSYVRRGGDVIYQGHDPYNPDDPIMSNFIHVNANKPRDNKNMLRCYISPDMTKDPSAVIYAWNECINESPLRDELYYKFNTKLNPERNASQRPDSIVIYKTENIDDGQFRELLQNFQDKCNGMSPDLLSADDSKMPAATQKIANGISISAEPDYINNYLRYTGKKAGKHSWTTFVDKMTSMSLTVAANRLGVTPESLDTPGLEEETKQVFREFMLLSKINPNTMLPMEFGDDLPSWTNLKDSSASEPIKGPEHSQHSSQITPEQIPDRKSLASGDKSFLYELTRPDGSKRRQLESEYFDIASKFADEHDIKSYSRDIRLAMTGLATDLAVIDVSHGEEFKNGDAEVKESLLEDFTTLRSILDDPNADPREKQLVKDYFNSMNGKAIHFLDRQYMRNQGDKQSKDNQNENPQAEAKDRYESRLSEAREELERAKKIFVDDFQEFNSSFLRINELFESRSMDLDELQSQLSNLVRKYEEMMSSRGSFIKTNKNYESKLNAGRAILIKSDYSASRIEVNHNESILDKTSHEIALAEERIPRFRNYISRVEEAIDSLRRF